MAYTTEIDDAYQLIESVNAHEEEIVKLKSRIKELETPKWSTFLDWLVNISVVVAVLLLFLKFSQIEAVVWK